MKVAVAMIGMGAIGTAVMARMQNDPHVHINQLLVRRSRQRDFARRLGDNCRVITDVAELADNTHLVLECAGHEAVRLFGSAVLQRGFDLCVASVGALADDGLRHHLTDCAETSGVQMILLPGAIGGIDALAAVGAEGLEKVVYSGRKPPMSWTGSPAEDLCNLAEIEQPFTFFNGSAADAARLYPRNANVVATVALAGIGFERTQVRLIADPAAAGNSHTIDARGPHLRATFTTEGAALPGNPKTSALTASSAVRLLKNRCRPLVV